MPEDVCFISTLLAKAPLLPPHQSERQYRRRAAVALLLRLSEYPTYALSDLDDLRTWCASTKPHFHIFFIKRAQNPRDRWSGHIALPGGHQEADETDEQTCIRETAEEVGINLNSDFLFLGRLQNRFIEKRSGDLCVVPMVFIHLNKEPPICVLQKSEVQAAWWIPEDTFTEYVRQQQQQSLLPQSQRERQPLLREFSIELKRYIPLAGYPICRSIVSLIGIDEIFFPCVFLPPPSTSSPPKNTNAKDYVLWGFTFGIISEFLDEAGIGRLRQQGDARFRCKSHGATVVIACIAGLLNVVRRFKFC